MEEELELRDLILILWKRRKLILGIFLLAVLAAAAVSFAIPPTYEVSTIIALGVFPDPTYTSQASAREILLSDELLLKVVSDLKLDVPREKFRSFKQTIKVEPVNDTNFLKISIQTTNRSEGKAIVEKMVELFKERSSASYQQYRQLLAGQLDAVRTRLSSVEADIKKTREVLSAIESTTGISSVEKDLRRSRTLEYLQSEESQRIELLDRYLALQKEINELKNVQVIRGAREPVYPVKPNKKLNVALAGMLGLMVGVFLAFGLDYFSRYPLKPEDQTL
ncbi:Wzz/FepE/Etk N-terminal domain-containing protein [Desulfofundulus thermocisternus]|uniref:Wzz/FepE/Etk N-terminal domain-containing protein n=1 Tax=Desulfofundulus thermocisternus TaxID=42471 RepID=UPI00217F1565|nr:Wzz/FepE/Etk N-terminal domain-containing protein [Desulfofundulus thermocisternus]MCS5697203.1 Wzz/FepE/Etk N-terminal domain-containing protein [Desulfofundulus thermocisternus]